MTPFLFGVAVGAFATGVGIAGALVALLFYGVRDDYF